MVGRVAVQCVTAAPEPSHAFDALVQRTYPHVRPNASLRCHSSSTVTMARQSRPAQSHGTNHTVAKGRHARQHAMRGTAVAQTSKENVPHVHADGAVCDAIRRSNCECCKVWNSNHGHARDCPVAPQYRTATRTSRTSMAAEGIAHALPSVESSGPSPPYSSVPALPASHRDGQPHTMRWAHHVPAACVQAIIHCTPLASGGRPSGSNQRRSFGERR